MCSRPRGRELFLDEQLILYSYSQHRGNKSDTVRRWKLIANYHLSGKSGENLGPEPCLTHVQLSRKLKRNPLSAAYTWQILSEKIKMYELMTTLTTFWRAADSLWIFTQLMLFGLVPFSPPIHVWASAPRPWALQKVTAVLCNETLQFVRAAVKP